MWPTRLAKENGGGAPSAIRLTDSTSLLAAAQAHTPQPTPNSLDHLHPGKHEVPQLLLRSQRVVVKVFHYGHQQLGQDARLHRAIRHLQITRIFFLNQRARCKIKREQVS